MRSSRPVFLNLWQIRLPLGAWVSILHRLSGLILLLAIPIAAWLLREAAATPEGFALAAAWLQSWPARLLLLLILWSLLHHLFAGLRFLALDLGLGLSREAARRSARLVLLAVVPALLGILLWQWVSR